MKKAVGLKEDVGRIKDGGEKRGENGEKKKQMRMGRGKEEERREDIRTENFKEKEQDFWASEKGKRVKKKIQKQSESKVRAKLEETDVDIRKWAMWWEKGQNRRGKCDRRTPDITLKRKIIMSFIFPSQNKRLQKNRIFQFAKAAFCNILFTVLDLRKVGPDPSCVTQRQES